MRTKEKAKTLDPLLDWIPDQVGDKRRGQASRMTERDRGKSKDPGSSITNVEDDRRKEHRLLRGMIVGLRLRLTRPSVIPVLLLSFLRKQESRVVALRTKEKAKTLDPLLDWIHSLIGSPIRSGTSVEDDRKRQRKKQRPWILYLTGSLPCLDPRSGRGQASGTSVEDDRRKEHRLLRGMIVGLRLRLTRPTRLSGPRGGGVGVAAAASARRVSPARVKMMTANVRGYETLMQK